MMEKRGRSPSLRQKNWIEQQICSRRSPELYSVVVEQKKLLTSAELKKVPIYSKYTVSSLLYAQNVKRPHSYSFDKTSKSPRRRSVDKPPPPPIALSKVMPTKTKSNEDNLSCSYTKTGSPKPEDAKKPHSRNYVHVMGSNNVKSQKQPTKVGFGSKTTVDDAEKKLRFHDDLLLSSKDVHNLLTTYEECDKITSSSESISNDDILIVEDDRDNQHLVEDLHGEMESQKGDDEILQCEVLVPICLEGNADMLHQSDSTCSDPDNVIMVVESVNNEHLNDHNDETNQQDEACETFDAGGDHLTRPNVVDKENQTAENEQVAQEVVHIGSKVVEDEERKRKEPEVKKGGDNVAPEKEDLISKMVVAYQQQVVAHRKKDIATHNSVTEETISKLREKRSNKVKALVGAFESVISHDQYNVLPKKIITHQ